MKKTLGSVSALLVSVYSFPVFAEASEQIVVTAWVERALSEEFDSRSVIEGRDLDLIDASNAGEMLQRLPSVNVSTNSRGEAIAFVRNAGERQVAVFFEGAAINIPWDNRLDLSLVPAGLIGGANLVAGPLAPHYGVNALAALGLRANESLHGRLSYGTGSRLNADVAIPLGPVVLGGGYSRRDGVPLSGKADLPYSQSGQSLRDNTDSRLANVFGRVSTSVGSGDLSLTAFHIWGRPPKGIGRRAHVFGATPIWIIPWLLPMRRCRWGRRQSCTPLPGFNDMASASTAIAMQVLNLCPIARLIAMKHGAHERFWRTRWAVPS
jgi:hypothetical protein